MGSRSAKLKIDVLPNGKIARRQKSDENQELTTELNKAPTQINKSTCCSKST